MQTESQTGDRSGADVDRRGVRTAAVARLRKIAFRALLALAPLALFGATADPAWSSFSDNLPFVYNPAAAAQVAIDGIPQNPNALAIGDLNGDGKPDLAVAGGYNTVTVLLGDGSGGFSPAPGSPVAIGTDVNVGADALAIGDLDGDGNPDLIVTLGGADKLAFLKGDGEGGFTPIVSTRTVGGLPDAVTIGDWTGDGTPDLIVSNGADNTVSILAGDGLGDFDEVPGSPLAVAAFPESITLADLNGDGRNDLVVGGRGTDSDPGMVTVVMHGGPTTSYKTGLCGSISCGTAVDAVAVGDLTGDGKLDIATAQSAEGGVGLLSGDGSGGFDWYGLYRVWGGGLGLEEDAGSPTALAIADLDGDGQNEVVVSDQTNQQVAIMANDGDVALAQVPAKQGAQPYDAGDGNIVTLGGTGYRTGYMPQAVAVADLNGDGKPDLVTADDATSDVTVYLQGKAAPDAPTVTSATAAARSADVTVARPLWDGGAAITGYTVTSSPGGKHCAIPGDEFTYRSGSCTVEGLTGGVAYTFTATATNSVGTGAASDPSDSVTPFNAVPGSPTGVTALAGYGRATISWSAPQDDGGSPITGYSVISYPGSATCSPASLADLSCAMTGLTVGTSYTFGVVATNAVGNSFRTLSGAVTPYGLPGAPTEVTAAGGPERAEVQWSAPAADGGSPITGYMVTSEPDGKTCSADATTLRCTVAGLTDGTDYTFTVVATNAAGAGPASDPSNAAMPAVPPFPPTGVTAVAGFEEARVSWTAPTDTGGAPIVGYTVTSDPEGKTCSTAGALSCTVAGLIPGTSYTFTVTARNATYAGSSSAASSAVTALAPWPQFTSGDAASFTVGEAGSFTVTASGSPAPSLSASGDLPDGVSFTDNGDGTATLAGTPADGSAGGHSVTITASNGIDPDATQTFTLTVEPGAGAGAGGGGGDGDGDGDGGTLPQTGATSDSGSPPDSGSTGPGGSKSTGPGGSGSAMAVVPAPRFSLRVRHTLNLRHGHTLVLHARPNFPATLRAVLRRGGRKVASWRAALKPAENVVRLVLPKAARRVGRATLVLSFFGAGKRTTRHVPIAIIARRAHRAPTREARRVHRAMPA